MGCATLQGSTALLGTEAGEIRMFSLADGVCELIMASHNAPVTALAVCWSVCGAFDGPVAVSGATDGSVKAWSLMADTGAHTFSLHAPLSAGAVAAGNDTHVAVQGSRRSQSWRATAARSAPSSCTAAARAARRRRTTALPSSGTWRAVRASARSSAAAAA